MRFKSRNTDGYQIFAVSGTNTVSFGVDFDAADTRGLLGFAIERSDPTENERYFVFGFKVFPSVIPIPTTRPRSELTTIRSRASSGTISPPSRVGLRILLSSAEGLAEKPRPQRPRRFRSRCAPSRCSPPKHDVFFNRGVASSQAYARKFENKKPDQLPLAKQKEALEWLSRSLDEAMLKFIADAKKNDTLLCCFYEFRYLPVATALKEAIDRGVNVRLIVDAKVNEKKGKNGRRKRASPARKT